jgi:hypothetical protein
LASDLPVCLPPDGDYRVLLGPAWQLGRRPEPAAHAASIAVLDDSIAVGKQEWPLPDRLRVIILDRL